jgi:branched-chain amino acid transport system ATP-binding protein
VVSRRDQIKRVAAGLFVERGVAGTSVRDIAEGVGMLSGSLYHHFPRTRSKQLAGVLSGGEQQMLLLARALLVRPRALLLDEMTTGLSPKIAGELLDHVRGLADSGITVLVAEPAPYRVSRIVDRGYVMIRVSLSAPQDDADELDTAYRAAMGMLEEAL